MPDSQVTTTSDSGRPPVELRGRMETLLTLALGSADPQALRPALVDKLRQAPDFFDRAPVILDLAALSGQVLNAAELLALIHEHRLLPVGARHGDEAQMRALATAGVPALRALVAREAPAKDLSATGAPDSHTPDGDIPATAAAAVEPPAVGSGAPTVVARPVRSGQQIYARGGDLVLLGSASPGCELIADGSIHVYGALRGRALCGVDGNGGARIFCQNLAAELVSVAGHYKLLDELPEALRGKPTQIWLDGEQLRIELI